MVAKAASGSTFKLTPKRKYATGALLSAACTHFAPCQSGTKLLGCGTRKYWQVNQPVPRQASKSQHQSRRWRPFFPHLRSFRAAECSASSFAITAGGADTLDTSEVIILIIFHF